MVWFLLAKNPDPVSIRLPVLTGYYFLGSRLGGVTRQGCHDSRKVYEVGIKNNRLHRPPPYYGPHTGQNVVKSFQVPLHAGAWTT